ncbi:FtsX-like permease family protein [Cryobacterium sp. SO1]|uniref:FtsX-like permease family protein n=1 Tax=Cryobacterium sp. SO1 TaxID=1897061 RepID=UPI0010238E12|nr:FtsX-like permease family protein [Cryobacterium sp. SO1]RZI36939.1 putative ABC transporter permease YknZ [Cryobacterium sp. SO1]
MITVLFAGLRATLARLLATGLAVALSVGFVVATLTLSATFTRTTEDSLAASMARADVLVTQTVAELASSDPRTSSDVLITLLPEVRAAPGVTGADVERLAYVDLRFGETRSVAQIGAVLDESVRWQTLTSGRWPQTPTETTIDQATAESLPAAEGDSLTVAAVGSGVSPTAVTVVGITAQQAAGVGSGGPTLLMQAKALNDPALFSLSTSILVAGDDADAVAASVSDVVAGASGILVQTRTEAVDDQTAQLSGSATVLTSILMAFAAIALFVASIVIANTFQVLVSQRTRELALLRCVGAGAGQVRRLILGEALLLGLVASALGVGIGVAGAGMLAELSRDGASGVHLGRLLIDPALLSVGFGIGVLLTVGSALSPAHRATRVRPVAALRAVAAPAGVRQGVIGAVVALALVGLGGTGLYLGATRSGLTLAVVSGVVSFLGILLASALFIPWIVRLVGSTIGWTSVPARLAARNATRNPARTASTAAALLVGVTLVTMMVVGVTSVRTSIGDKIDEKRPVDLTVQSVDPVGMTAEQIDGISAMPDVQDATSVASAQLTITPAGGAFVVLPARGLDSVEAQRVARSPVLLPEDGQLLLNPADAGAMQDGENVTVTGDAGSAELTVAFAATAPRKQATLTKTDLLGLVVTPVTGQVQLRLGDGITSSQVQELSSDILSVSETFTVGGGAPERTYYEQILDVMLLIVLALLTMAVVIACVGVANTMALSVYERRRESALLRALGLTRGQLRTTLGIEATLITVVAAACGVGLGVLYAWAGLSAVALQAQKLALTVHLPWTQLGIVLLGALVAGLLATVVPASAAARRSPVESLSYE